MCYLAGNPGLQQDFFINRFIMKLYLVTVKRPIVKHFCDILIRLRREKSIKMCSSSGYYSVELQALKVLLDVCVVTLLIT